MNEQIDTIGLAMFQAISALNAVLTETTNKQTKNKIQKIIQKLEKIK